MIRKKNKSQRVTHDTDTGKSIRLTIDVSKYHSSNNDRRVTRVIIQTPLSKMIRSMIK